MTQGHVFKSFASKAELQTAAAAWIAAALTDAIARRGSAVFMGSGGTTPGPIYEALSNADLDWASVQIGLCDERWVDVDHPASNGAMMARTLLQNKAAAADYTPMKIAGKDPFRAIEQVNELYMDASLTDVMLLGMGPDAHTLSWFQGGRGYEDAVSADSTSVVAAVEAMESEVTGPEPVAHDPDPALRRLCPQCPSPDYRRGEKGGVRIRTIRRPRQHYEARRWSRAHRLLLRLGRRFL